MSGISKRVSGSWVSGDYGIMKTATDTITTLPADIYANDTTATVGLKGNMNQTGSPTPQNPIQPSECGERTGNLCDIDGFTSGETEIKLLQTITLNAGTYTYSCMQKDAMTSNTRNTLVVRVNQAGYIYEYTQPNYHLNAGAHSLTFTVSSDNATIELRYWVNDFSNACDFDSFMLNTGSTPLPYEHYGYKIPISSAGQTNNIYLGEVQSTRKIKKLVLDGTEGWTSSQSDDKRFFFMTLAESDYTILDGGFVCSHFAQAAISNNNTDIGIGQGGRSQIRIRPENSGSQSGNDFTLWLAQQYSAGTPVCVWYILAEPTTGIVNEPIRKIGEYADTVSGITIPTIAGANSFDVLTTLKPSEVTVNYKGWHPVSDVHEKSRNLFDKSKRTDNSRVVYTTGEIGNLPSVFVSDFTPIEPNTTYTLNIVSSISSKTGHLFALYDKNKNFVNTGSHEATSATVYTFTTPSNVAYIRFNGNMASADEIMFNTGSSTLPYEPYWK